MKPLKVSNHIFDWGSRTYVMGVLNVTPDSFSGDGLLTPSPMLRDPLPNLGEGNAIEQARRFVGAGAAVLDVGGESTRPGSAPVEVEEERRRVIPVIKALAKEFPDTLISIDTYKAVIAEEALNSGAHIVNDVWALRADFELRNVISKMKCPVILMHNRSNPASVEVRTNLGSAFIGADYADLLEDVKRELMDSVRLARQAGIEDERIILDPGIGFGKKVEHNLELINRLDEIRALGFPVLLGPSRKSFIGYTLDLPADQRIEGTAAAVAVGIARGADIVRVHDVEYMARVAKMTDALTRRKVND
ncbi:MAG: dihydropteroate synthase [Chloroflexi bacterium]|nr:dihydropteroate synthase [Chloroflexota bacterium]